MKKLILSAAVILLSSISMPLYAHYWEGETEHERRGMPVTRCEQNIIEFSSGYRFEPSLKIIHNPSVVVRVNPWFAVKLSDDRHAHRRYYDRHDRDEWNCHRDHDHYRHGCRNSRW